MEIFQLSISTVKDNLNWILVFENSAKNGSVALGLNRKTILDPRKSWITLE
jgi:hypothetical protein